MDVENRVPHHAPNHWRRESYYAATVSQHSEPTLEASSPLPHYLRERVRVREPRWVRMGEASVEREIGSLTPALWECRFSREHALRDAARRRRLLRANGAWLAFIDLFSVRAEEAPSSGGVSTHGCEFIDSLSDAGEGALSNTGASRVAGVSARWALFVSVVNLVRNGN